MASTIQKVNFEPVSDALVLTRRTFPLADKTLADPMNALCVLDGEFLTLDANYKVIRACDVTNNTAVAAVKSFPCFDERGRTDRLGLSSKGTTIIYRGEWEFDTRIYDSAAGTSPITTPMQGVKAATITIGTRNYVGLIGHGGSADTDPVVGYVTRLPTSNGGKLRIISGYRV